MSRPWIFFDVGSTLVDESEAYDARNREMLATSAVSPEAFAVRRREFARRGEDGNAAAIRYFGLERTKWPSHLEHPYPDAIPALETLRKLGYPLGIIANQSPGLEDRLERWGLRDYFTVVASSAELGMEKPDPAIFHAALQMAHCLPENAVMVGDRLFNDIVPAHDLGFNTAWVRRGLAVCHDPSAGAGLADAIVDDLTQLVTLFS